MRLQQPKEVMNRAMNMDRKKIAIILTAVAVAAIFGGIALSAYAANNGEDSNSEFAGWINGRPMLGPCGFPGGGRHGPRGFGFIEVSEEFEQNVINIAKNDTDVQTLLDEGYNITGVRPNIKTIVEADGTVATKATSAIVMLEKDTTGCASVWVDIEQAKVTEIVILTRTVIEKP